MKLLVVLVVCVFFVGAYGGCISGDYDELIFGLGKLMNKVEIYLSPQVPCKI